MLDRVLRFSIERRLAVVLAVVALAALGIYSVIHLPIDAVPDITNNQVQINTLVPSLSPVETEKQVTFPIETALSGIPGLLYTRSLSRNAFSQVTAVFANDVSIYFARQQVAERLVEAREGLPPGAEPRMGAISTGLGEIYMWTVEYVHTDPTGKITPGEAGWQPDGTYLTPEREVLRTAVEKAAYLRTLQDWLIRPQIKSVAGVAGVDAIGGYVKQYHVQPDPRLLVAYGLTFHDLLNALEENNLSTGAGYVEHNGESWLVRATGRVERAEQISAIAVGERSGVPVYIRDVASVAVGPELRTGSASENGEEIVVGTALMLIGANSRTVSNAVDQKMHEVNRTLPPGIRAKTVLNRTRLVDATIATVEKNLIEGAVLVIAVLLLLLGNLRAAVITAMAIPLSMLFTATAMVQTRTSGNLMSLGAIDFGLIVDGAVIMIENCLRLFSERQEHLGRQLTLSERLETTYRAGREVLRPAAYGNAIIIIVYVPILFLTGVEGKMFWPMAITVIFALTAAFVLSLTFVPAMVALAIRRSAERENPIIRIAKRAYEPVLKFALRHRLVVPLSAAILFAGSLVLFSRLGQEFVPTLSELDVAVQAIRIPSTSLTQATEMQFTMERAIHKLPEVAFVFSKTGTAELAADPMPPNVSDTFVILKPRSEWPDPGVTKEQVRERIESTLEGLFGNNYEFTQPIQMRFNELIAGVRGDVAVKVFGDDFDTLSPVADRVADILRATPGAADVRTEQIAGLPVLSVDVDRSAVARHGLSVSDVQDVVAVAVGGREAGQVFQGDRRFDIVVRLPESFRRDLDALKSLPVPLSHDREEFKEVTEIREEQPRRFAFLPLVSVADVKLVEGPNQISRENGKRRIVVQANVRGRDIGSFVDEARRRIDAEIKLPSGSWLVWGGQFENLVSAKQRLSVLVPICLAVIGILLYSDLQSFRQAAMVFSGVPLALSGGIVSLWLRGMPFSISAAVGFIALSGIAVLNGLVLISFINQLREQGEPLDAAVVEGSLKRLRPVLMTAMVASLGFVPMALATGTGAEVQRPLATVVIGGLITSTALTLVVLPALYRLLTPASASVAEEEPG